MTRYQTARYRGKYVGVRLLAAIGLVAVLLAVLQPAPALSEPRCTAATTHADDVTIRSYHNCASNFKATASEYFRFEKSHWDQGWGWVRCNTDRPFGKMMNAAFLLSFGLEPWETYARGWYLFALHHWVAENATLDSANAGTGLEITPDPAAYPPAVFYQTDFDIQLVGINAAGDLIHYRGGQVSGDWFAENITDTLVPAYTRSYHRLKESPIYISNGTYDHFFGLSNERDVVMYRRHGLGGPWTAQNLTRDLTNRFSLRSYRRLTAVNHGGLVSAFGINRQGHLIRYRLGSIQDITQTVGSADPDLLLNSRLLSTVHSERMHVYGLNANRQLIHYFQTPAGVWTAEKVSEANNQRLLTNAVQPALVADAGDGDTLYGVSQPGHLLRYARNAAGNWSVTDMTANLSAPGNIYNLDHRYALSPASDPGGGIHIFGLNSSGDLIHYTVAGTAISAENVTTIQPNNGARFKASLSPAAISGVEGSLHVYVRGLYGQLYHYYRSPAVNWRVDDITTRVSIGIGYNIIGRPIVVKRSNHSHHVMAPNRQGELIHYYTSGQAHAWHANRDYAWLAAGSVHDYSYKPEDRWDSVAAAQGGFWQADQVKMRCPSFDGSSTEGGPEGRAAAMLHEATHVIYWRWQHQAHPTLPNLDADDWLFHGINAYPPENLNLDRRHSMYQIQVEYLSDLGEFPAKWVPLTTSTAALGLAGTYMFNIINPPAWTPGDPRPF